MSASAVMTKFKKEVIRPTLVAGDLFDKPELAAIKTAFEIPELIAFKFRFGWSNGSATCEPTQGAEYILATDDPSSAACKRWKDLRGTAPDTRMALADVALDFASSTRIQTYLERLDPTPFFDKNSSVEILLMRDCMIIYDDEFYYRDAHSAGGLEAMSALCCTIVTQKVKSSHESLKRMKAIETGYARYCDLNRNLLTYLIARNVHIKPPSEDEWTVLNAQG